MDLAACWALKARCEARFPGCAFSPPLAWTRTEVSVQRAARSLRGERGRSFSFEGSAAAPLELPSRNPRGCRGGYIAVSDSSTHAWSPETRSAPQWSQVDWLASPSASGAPHAWHPSDV